MHVKATTYIKFVVHLSAKEGECYLKVQKHGAEQVMCL